VVKMAGLKSEESAYPSLLWDGRDWSDGTKFVSACHIFCWCEVV
jgi:hypothetical protein